MWLTLYKWTLMSGTEILPAYLCALVKSIAGKRSSGGLVVEKKEIRLEGLWFEATANVQMLCFGLFEVLGYNCII